MQIRDGFVGTVGDTPLIRLRRASEETSCTILGKAEFLNPGGSVKDRAALYIIKDAEEHGLLRPGGVIVEGTAGNTGIGLALVGNARGYRTVIVMPETQSQEKKDMLRLCGADLRLVPAAPYANPNNYVRYSERLAAEIAAAGAERGGVGEPVRQSRQPPRPLRDDRPRNLAADPTARSTGLRARLVPAARCRGSASRSRSATPTSRSIWRIAWDRGSTAGTRGASSSRRGIRSPRASATTAKPRISKGFTPDGQFQITDAEMLPVLFGLASEEGLVLGGSTGINVCGAIRLARLLGPGHTIVTILADSGTRYHVEIVQPRLFEGTQPACPGMAVKREVAASR